MRRAAAPTAATAATAAASSCARRRATQTSPTSRTSGTGGQRAASTARAPIASAAAGDDLIIEVPPGTLVRDRDRGHLLADLKAPDEQVVVARGGRGGHGNAHFKSSTNRAPRQVEKGHPGEERWITLELKVIADVGLIGLPNAGKSTLLSRISRAHPEIADYPFTTKYPNLGSVVAGEKTFVVADIPGLIEGAHVGHGLGHEFLRHVERTSLLVHLVEAVPLDGSDPVENYRTIRNELPQYSPALAERPELVVVTKMDVTGASEARDRIASELGRDVLAISAVTGQGIPELIHRIVAMLAAQSRVADGRAGSRCPPDAGRVGGRCLSHAPHRGRPGQHPAQMGESEPSRAACSTRSPCRLIQQPGTRPGPLTRISPARFRPGRSRRSTRPLRQQLAVFLESKGVRELTWFDTAAQVPLRFDVEGADTGGADRALAVAAAIRLMPPGRPGLVVSCGTAITVERITAEGVWQGGAIAPGLGMSAQALHLLHRPAPGDRCPSLRPRAATRAMGPVDPIVARSGRLLGNRRRSPRDHRPPSRRSGF